MADKFIDRTRFSPTYRFTEGPGHATELARELIQAGTEILVAVGGDGTINEVASALDGSGKTMGIVPYGSGNGLARSLGIPLNDKQAIKRLNRLDISRIDSGVLNGKCFFNMAGIGFDAHISAVFARNIKRGLGGYVKTAIKEISSYQCDHYLLEIDGKQIARDAFMISIANSSQFGNNAHISPFASLKDGFLDVCITKPFPLYQFPILGYRMFNRSVHKSKYLELIKARNIKVSRQGGGTVHLDGEPCEMPSVLDIKVKPLSLSVII